MFRNHPGGWNAARQAVFTLLPLVIGAGVLVAGGDGPAGMSRLEVTQSTVTPLLERAGVEVEAPPAVGGGEPAAEAEAEAGAGAMVEGPGAVAVAPEAGGLGPAAAAVTAADSGTGEAGAPAGVDVEAGSPASAGPETGAPPTTTPASTSTSTSTTTTTTAPARSGRARDTEAEVVPLTNADRAAAGLGSLSRNGCLDAVAAGYAEQMARRGVLAHNPGAGDAVTGCRANATWGDNVGWSTACDTARLEREWMASPSHRKNILTGAFTLIGVGAWTDEAGECWVQVLFST